MPKRRSYGVRVVTLSPKEYSFKRERVEHLYPCKVCKSLYWSACVRSKFCGQVCRNRNWILKKRMTYIHGLV